MVRCQVGQPPAESGCASAFLLANGFGARGLVTVRQPKRLGARTRKGKDEQVWHRTGLARHVLLAPRRQL